MPPSEQPRSAALEKKGGYSGGRPAATMRPPVKVPSGAARPASPTTPQATQR